MSENEPLQAPHEHDVGTKPRAAKIRSIVLIFLIYALVSGLALSSFVLYLDFSTELFYGPTNTGELCSRSTKSGIGFWTQNNSFCFVRLEYVALVLLAFPASTVMWQALFGLSTLIFIFGWRRIARLDVRSQSQGAYRIEEMFSPFAVATMFYLIGVFFIGGAQSMIFSLSRSNPEWRETLREVSSYVPLLEYYSAFSLFFLFAPVPIFVAFVYLRRRLIR